MLILHISIFFYLKGASLMAQMVKNSPMVQKTWIQYHVYNITPNEPNIYSKKNMFFPNHFLRATFAVRLGIQGGMCLF